MSDRTVLITGATVGEGAASVIWAIDIADDGPGGFFRHGEPLAW